MISQFFFMIKSYLLYFKNDILYINIRIDINKNGEKNEGKKCSI